MMRNPAVETSSAGGATAPMAGRDEFAIVIPAYNAARYLRETLTSALSAGAGLAEVIVVDDGSSDATATVAAGFPQITVIRQANGGVSRARNAGLARVRADYVCFLDADDVLRPGALDLLRACLRDTPAACAAFGRVAYIDPASDPCPYAARPRWLKPSVAFSDVLCANVIDTPGAILFRTEAVRGAGGFTPGLVMAEDWEMYVRAALRGPFVGSVATVLDYRVHSVSAMRRQSLGIEDFEPALRKVFGNGKSYAGRIGPAALRRCELRNRAGILRMLGQNPGSVGRSLRLLAGLSGLALQAKFDPSVVALWGRAALRVGRRLVGGERRMSGDPCL